VAASGHEIGNHSLSHPASTNFTGVPGGGYEDATLEELEGDILAAQARLERIAPHQREWTFCYPCYITDVGRGGSRQSYVPVVAHHFLAGRARGEYGHGNYPATVDLACLWALPAEGMNGFELIGLAEELTARGQWVVFVFHEVGGERLSVDRYALAMFLNFLDRRRDTIRTGTVMEIARDVARFQAGLHASEGSS
jgi:peptidoglycan/xylan/chitin deacetylase (PgdA/CDA1 family)